MTIQKILGIGLLVLFSACSSSESEQRKNLKNTLFKDIEQENQNTSIDPTKNQLVTMDDGVTFFVPKDALVDKNGEVVKGPVDLKYTSFNSPASIIASGLPMTVKDEQGESKQLESAGMFDLRAYADGDEVYVKKGSEIEVTMPSPSGDDYDLYFFEEPNHEVAENYSNIFKSPPTIAVGNNQPNRAGGWKKIKDAVKEKHTKIKRGESFKLKWDLNRNPNLKDIAKLKWEYGQVDPSMNPFSEENKWVLDQDWETYKISQPKFYGIKRGEYGEAFENGFKYLGHKSGYEVFEAGYPKKVYLLDIKSGEVREIDGRIEKDGFWHRVHPHNYSTDFQYHDFLTAQKCFVIRERSNSVLFDDRFNKIQDLGSTSSLRYDFGKDELVYASSVDYNSTVLRCIKSSGELVREKVVPYGRVNLSHDGKYFYLNAASEHVVFSTLNFELKAKKKILEYNAAYRLFGGDHGLWMESSDRKAKKFSFWHWESGDVILYPKPMTWREAKVHPFTGNLLVYNDEQTKRDEWDWRTKKVTGVEYTGYIEPHVYPGNEVVKLHTNHGSKIRVENRQGENPFCPHQDHCYGQSSNFTGDRFISSANDTVQLYDKFGVKEKSIGYRFSSRGSGWIDDSTFLVKYADGSIGCYDKDGEVRSFNVGRVPVDVNTIFSTGDYTVPITEFYSWTPVASVNGLWGNSVYNPSGEIVLDLTGRGALATFGFDLNRFCTMHRKSVSWYDRTEEVTDKSIYRLTLIAGDSAFVTTVHLSDEQRAIIDRNLYPRKAKKRDTALQNVNKNSVMRSFRISQFGVYNFDRYYEDDLIKCKPEIVLQGEKDDVLDQCTLFLITGENNRAVVKFWPGVWDQFYFSATWDNQLLIVLPDERIATFSKEAFKKLDSEKIRKEGSCRFILKVHSKRKSVKELEKILSVSK